MKKEKGAKSRCRVLGHKHSLKATKVVGEDGAKLADLRGAVSHHLKTERSHTFIRGHHGERTTVTGKIYALERILEVASHAQQARPWVGVRCSIKLRVGRC